MNTNEAKKRSTKKPFNSISYTTGDIDLNINRFNQAMGSLEGSEAGVGCAGALSEEANLQEAKRYVRRYYFRPMGKFASNKAEVLKTLIDIGDQNCTIYTLNNLDDNNDVSKLSNKDIIYTYDSGILRDKNGIKIMDYDLSIKKEEERKKFADVNKASEREFRAEYEDRMTSATELEEDIEDDLWDTCPYEVISADYNKVGDKFIVSLNHNVLNVEDAAEELIAWVENAYGISVIDWNTNGSNVFIFDLAPYNEFNLDFDDVNVYGEKLTEAKERCCCICGEPIEGYGNNPEPYMSADEGQACDGCNLKFVVPMRLEQSRED